MKEVDKVSGEIRDLRLDRIPVPEARHGTVTKSQPCLNDIASLFLTALQQDDAVLKRLTLQHHLLFSFIPIHICRA